MDNAHKSNLMNATRGKVRPGGARARAAATLSRYGDWRGDLLACRCCWYVDTDTDTAADTAASDLQLVISFACWFQIEIQFVAVASWQAAVAEANKVWSFWQSVDFNMFCQHLHNNNNCSACPSMLQLSVLCLRLRLALAPCTVKCNA